MTSFEDNAVDLSFNIHGFAARATASKNIKRDWKTVLSAFKEVCEELGGQIEDNYPFGGTTCTLPSTPEKSVAIGIDPFSETFTVSVVKETEKGVSVEAEKLKVKQIGFLTIKEDLCMDLVETYIIVDGEEEDTGKEISLEITGNYVERKNEGFIGISGGKLDRTYVLLKGKLENGKEMSLEEIKTVLGI